MYLMLFNYVSRAWLVLFFFFFFLLLSSNVFRHKINGGPPIPNPKSPLFFKGRKWERKEIVDRGSHSIQQNLKTSFFN